MGKRDPAIFIAPGFRFHPTDEELVKFYLKRKVSGKAFRIDAISDADVYKFEPWDLPDKSSLKSRDLEWYFFSGLDKKYGHGSKTNRATQRGYWKTTGKDKNIYNNSDLVGLKKTLVYHIGRAPKGERTDWVMHEYRLADSELKKTGVAQASFVLCRIFQKSGPGPKNGEQHVAPFVEEEWEDEEEEVLITDGLAEDKALISDCAYIETDDLEQLIDFSVVPENNPLQVNYYQGGNSNQTVDSVEFSEDGQKPLIGTHESLRDSKLLMPEQQNVIEHNTYEVGGKLPIVKSFAEADEGNTGDINYLLDEPYFDENFSDVLNDGLYLETDDLLGSINADPASFDMLNEYLSEFNANDEILYLPPNNSFVATETQLPQESHFVQKKAIEEQKMVPASKQLAGALGRNDVSSSNQNYTKLGSGSRTPVVKHANRMLESIPAPTAFAAEFPAKEAALRLALAMESQNSLNFTASTILARNGSNCLSRSSDKKGNVQLIFSLSVAQGEDCMQSAASLDGNVSSKKRTTATSQIWMYLALFWVSILFVSMKIGPCVYSK